MDLKKKIAEHSENIEKFLIAFIFLSVILSFLFKDYSEELIISTLSFQIILVLFYAFQIGQKVYLLLWLGFFLQLISKLFVLHLNYNLFIYFNAIPFVAFGVILLIKAFKMSYTHKSFELLTFIAGFLLVIQAFMPLLMKYAEVFTFYSFALSFSLGTIIYNDNLWHRYNQDEKNIIKYILISSLIIVIGTSAKYL